MKNIFKKIIDLTVNEEKPETKIKGLKITGYPHVSRFFEYKEILENHPDASHVLLTDVRDVFSKVILLRILAKVYLSEWKIQTLR